MSRLIIPNINRRLLLASTVCLLSERAKGQLSTTFAGPAVGYAGPGDFASGASSAHMLHGYSFATSNISQCVNLRRSSDNVTLDFGLSAGVLNQPAIATWGGTFATGTGSSVGTTFTFTGSLLPGMQVDPTGAAGYLPGTLIISGASPTWTTNKSQTVGSGTVAVANGLYVTKVYDQTGNSSGLLQATAANQPFFALNAMNGNAAMWFNNDGGLVLVSSTIGNPWATGGWALMAMNYVGTTANACRLFDWGAAGTPRLQFTGISTATLTFFQGTNATNGTWVTTNTLSNASHIVDVTFSQAALSTPPVLLFDGTSQGFASSTSGTGTAVTSTSVSYGSLGTTIRGFPGFFNDLITYATVPSSAAQEAARLNIGAYYGVVVA